MARALEVAGQLAIRDGVADAQAGEARDLREGADRHRTRSARDPAERVGEIRAAREVDVGLVDQQHDVVGQARREAVEGRGADARAGRVVRVADHHDARALGDRGGHRVEVVDEIGVERHRDRRGAHALRHDRVHRERRPREDGFVAGPEERLRDQLQQLVGAAAEDELLGRDAELLDELRAQREARAVRIAMHARRARAARLRSRAATVRAGSRSRRASPRPRCRARARAPRSACPADTARARRSTASRASRASRRGASAAVARGNEPSTRCE